MRSIRRAAAMTMATVTLVLGACAGDESDKAAAEPDAASSRNRALLDAAQQPLDRARATEDIAAGRKGALDQQIDASAE